MDIRKFLPNTSKRFLDHDASQDNYSKRARCDPPTCPSTSAISFRNADLDIATYMGRQLSDEDKYNIIKNHFQPDSSHKFPSTKFGQKQRSFQLAWISRFPGLVYSPSTDGAFCLHCFLFPGGAERKCQLVSEPFRNWKKAVERFDEHFHKIRHNSGDNSASSHKKTGTGHELHMDSVVKSTNFLKCKEDKQVPIHHQIDAALEARKERNMKVLETIVETVLFCGRQNISLRGHRDDSRHSADPSVNTGNFKALLEYRIKGGDSNLQHHLENGPKNATYISKTTQNEIITTIGNYILRKVVNDCLASGGFYSLSADEVRDISNHEQLAVTIRFVDNTGEIREDFLSFINVSEGTTGENLSHELLNLIDQVGLDRNKMRSQCYDGAGNMAGKTKGVGPRIQQQYPKALPFWCTAHQLNRCIVQACTIPAVRNMMSTADQVVRFFEFSPKKQDCLEEAINALELPENKRHKLKELCRTRWVERHDAFDVFIDFLPATVETLEMYAKLPNTRTPGAADASSLLNSVCTFDFLVCLIIVHKCLGYLRGLSKSLQERTLDVGRALKNVTLVKASLQSCRDDIDNVHQEWFQEAVALAEELDIPISKPRTCGRQSKRNNVPAQSPEDYYRKSISIPVLDHLLEEMKTRFTSLHQRAALGLMLVPSELDERNIDIGALTEFFGDDLPSSRTLEAEMRQWKIFWKENPEKPSSISATIKACDKDFFSNIHTILKICGTFPVTSCECERSISCLRLLKTYLRSTMGQDRLSALALMFIHRTVNVRVTDIVTEFARKHPRRMQVPNILFEE
ncbi:52 kDa repressor of the inhibitor of the protein kinase-like [Argopecten irradians]|uniref:52 kDa repressor of the inhibitor of the protein kinase-like n=1 Tax=Argopecten irradians TaxID=31199 RepID=UPI0037104B84